ncbi:FecR family protein [Carboxylicivirga sediminis]|uniref:FecR family protein n=1 Tax=Carboxylicivirga sediminis TaxID=2006564 RepID=A0A941F4Q2_9BACT|nr:FecR family protein [Carboxylicivirga sediminis]MBR8535898.1 FecR family protein [Carboxylicivirga sediminis]
MESKITKYLQGTASPDEQSELLKFIRASNKNREYFQLQKEKWKLDSKKVYHFRTDNAWKEFEKTVVLKRYSNRKLKIFLLTVASVVITALCVTTILFYSTAMNQDVLVQTRLKQKLEVTLPDSSKVILNENTTLSYNPLQFIFSRRVSMEGEAFFDIRPDNLKFIVNSGPINIEVLGTKFNVNSDSENVDVLLEEGSVMLTHDVNKDFKQILVPGELASYTYSLNELHVDKVTSWENIVWSKEDLQVKNIALDKFFVELGLRYGVKFELDANDSLRNLKVSLTVKDDTLADILDVIQLSMPIVITKERTAYKVVLDEKRISLIR